MNKRIGNRLFNEWLIPLCRRNKDRSFLPESKRWITYDDLLNDILNSTSEYHKNYKDYKENKQYEMITPVCNSVDLLSSIFSLWSINKTPCIVPWYLSQEQKKYCSDLINETNLKNGLKNDDALVLFTSGTTSKNLKGVRLSCENIISQLEQLHHHNPPTGWLSHKDRTLSLMPWSHCYGLIGECFSVMDRGASTTLHPPKFDIPQWIRQTQSFQPSVIFGVPLLFEKFKKLDEQVLAKTFFLTPKMRRSVLFGPRLRYLVSGGSFLDPKTQEYFEEKLDVPIYQGYGCTEMSPMISLENSKFHEKYYPENLPFLGRVLPGVEIKCNDKTSELYVRGPSRFVGYLGEKPFGKDDWFKTGDAVVVNEKTSGLFFKNRISHQIKLPNGRFTSIFDIEKEIITVLFDLYGKKDKKFLHQFQICVCNDGGVLMAFVYHPLLVFDFPSDLFLTKYKLHATLKKCPRDFLSRELGTVSVKGDVLRHRVQELYLAR